MGIKTKSGGAIYNVKIYDQKTPVVEKIEKVDNEYKVTERGSNFSGKLVGCSVEQYEYKGDTKRKLILKFLDEEGGNESLSMNFNYLTLGIINTLSNEDDLHGRELELAFYEKDENARCYMTMAGTEKMNWKFSGDEFSKISKAGEPKWEDMFNQFIKPKFEGKGAVVGSSQTTTSNSTGQPLGDDPFDSYPIADKVEEDEFDPTDLPF
jgi:hypothetical protein